jgi:hypothetical protein
MFKKLTLALTAFLFILNANSLMAMDFSDVPEGYWAYTPITSLASESIISGYSDNTFKPENHVKRAEFATMLVKTLSQEKLETSGDLPYTDVNISVCSFTDICRINDLKLVVGYPDKTFKPDAFITKAEVMTVLANTLSESYLGSDEAKTILSAFQDNKSIPNWATDPVSKSIKNDYFVKYPDPSIIAVNNQATRAEVAELLYKLRQNLLLKTKQETPEIVIREAIMENEIPAVEHLSYMYSDKGINEVKVKRLEASISEGNVLKTVFVSDFNTKKAAENGKIQLTITEDLYTKEGTFLIPAGSIFEGSISTLQGAKLYNRNAKVGFNIYQLILPSGKTYDISAKIASPSGLLEQDYNRRNFKRDAIVTLGTAGFGAAVGALAGLDNHSGMGSIIGVSSGFGIGALGAAIVPGYPLEFKKGDKVFIKLVKDITIDR